MSGERDLDRLLGSMDPVLVPGEFVFVSVPSAAALPALATVREAEGTTVVLHRRDADEHSLRYEFVAAWITLRVHSALDAVGLVAAVSGALGAAGISCNVLAGYYHDHLLVPYDRAADAVAVLGTLRLSRRG